MIIANQMKLGMPRMRIGSVWVMSSSLSLTDSREYCLVSSA